MTLPSATTLTRFHKRAVELQALFGIDRIEEIGVFRYNQKMKAVEYVMHEIAHGLTMGFVQLPPALPGQVAEMVLRFSVQTRDHLEIDATFVTFEALRRLRLVEQSRMPDFAKQCAESMDGDCFMERTHLIVDQLEQRTEDKALLEQVSSLVQIMRAPLSLVRMTYLMPVHGVPSTQ